MKFNVNREALVKELAFVESAVKDIINPAFGSVLFRWQDGLQLVAGDGTKIVALGTIPMSEAPPVTDFVVQTTRLHQMLKMVNTDSVEFNVTNNSVTLNVGKSKLRFPKSPESVETINHFANLASFDTVGTTCDAKIFLDELVKTDSFAADKDSNKYNISGAWFEFGQDKIIASATDGYRIVEITSNQSVPFTERYLYVPSELFKPLTNMMVDIQPQDMIEIFITKQMLMFRFKNRVLRANQMVAVRPAFGSVFPSDTKSSVELTAKDLLMAAKRLQVMTTEKKASLNFDGKNLIVKLTDVNSGSSFEEEIQVDKGNDVQFTMNIDHVVDALKVFDGDNEKVVIRHGSGQKAALFDNLTNTRCVVACMS